MADTAFPPSATISTGGGAPAPHAMMIEQRPMEKPNRSAALDEARLRQQAIGVKLRQMFDDVVNEPVPDEFLNILRKADENAAEKD